MLIVEVTWWEGDVQPASHASCQLVFSGENRVDVTAHEAASIAASRWDEIRHRVLVATTESELAAIYKGTPLGQSFARGERLANRNAFIALHAFGPQLSDVTLIESFIPDMLADQYGNRIFKDMRDPPNDLFVLPTPRSEDRAALTELYRIGRLHRLAFRRIATPPDTRTSEWSTFFVPFRSPAISLGSVSTDAWDLSGRIHAAYRTLGGE